MSSRVIASFRTHRLAYVLAMISGVLYFVGFCGFDQFYLSWICLVPVLWALDEPSLSHKEALAIAWLFGWVTHLGGYTWITNMLRDFGHLPIPAAFCGYLVLCLLQATLLAAWGWVVFRLATRGGLPLVWVAPVAMVVAEWLWPALFPSYLSNSQYRQITLIQSADLWGPLGLTFMLTLASAVIYQTLAWRLRGRGRAPWLAWGVLALLIAGDLGYGLFAVRRADDAVSRAASKIKVGLAQPNMGIFEKKKRPKEGLRRLQEQSLKLVAQGAELLVWPESAVQYSISKDEHEDVRRLVLGRIRTPLLFGGIRVERETGVRQTFNTANLVSAEGKILGTYDKTYLLAFGEYLPLGEWLPGLYNLSIFRNASHFSPGTRTDPLVLDGLRLGLLICYEDTIPRFVREVMAHEPHLLVNLANDAWFGESREPLIHLALSVFRAVEHRRFLVRSTNTGISAFIDPAGRLLETGPLFERANLLHEVAALEGRTIYGRLGDWVGMACLAVLLCWLVVLRRQRQESEPARAPRRRRTKRSSRE